MTRRTVPKRLGAVRLQMVAATNWLVDELNDGNLTAAFGSVRRPIWGSFKRRTTSLTSVSAACQQHQGRASTTPAASLGLGLLRRTDRWTRACGLSDPQTSEFQFGIKVPTKLVRTFEENLMNIGGVDVLIF